MAVHTTTAVPLARPRRGRLTLGSAKRTIAHFAQSIHDVLDGSSFEPGRHSLTRVQSPSERQTPR